MLICCKCRRELSRERDNIGADFGGGHILEGDLYRCACGVEVLHTVDESVFDPQYVGCEAYVVMDSPCTPTPESVEALNHAD